jgi:hypothetical protein
MGTWEHENMRRKKMGTQTLQREDGETWVESGVAVGAVSLRSAKWGRGWECNKRSQGDVQ